MRWRHVVVYWLSAVALGSWLYIDSKSERPTEKNEARLAPLVSAPAKPFDEIVITRGAERLRFGLRDGRWLLVEPGDLRVATDLVPALLDTLSTIPPIERLETESRTAPQFGLEPPQVRVSLRAGASHLAEIDVGRRNPTRTAVYASVDGGDVVYLLGLNAQYYLELIFDEVSRQRSGPGD